MTPDLYLIAPPEATPAAVLAAIDAAGAGGAAALLLPRGTRSENAYKDFVKAVVKPAQAADIAVLVEGPPELVRLLGADGLHVTGGIGAVREAVEALKPDMIVGIGDVRTRHDAMQKAELGIDYVLFGPLSGAIDDAQRELARWWAETMQVPGVLSDPEASAQSIDTAGCDFAGIAIATEPRP